MAAAIAPEVEKIRRNYALYVANLATIHTSYLP